MQGVVQRMGDYPANLIEFEDRFRTEAECRAYLENVRWPDGFRCPQCVLPPSPTSRASRSRILDKYRIRPVKQGLSKPDIPLSY